MGKWGVALMAQVEGWRWRAINFMGVSSNKLCDNMRDSHLDMGWTQPSSDKGVPKNDYGNPRLNQGSGFMTSLDLNAQRNASYLGGSCEHPIWVNFITTSLFSRALGIFFFSVGESSQNGPSGPSGLWKIVIYPDRFGWFYHSYTK